MKTEEGGKGEGGEEEGSSGFVFFIISFLLFNRLLSCASLKVKLIIIQPMD